jgi:hypothetical protein
MSAISDVPKDILHLYAEHWTVRDLHTLLITSKRCYDLYHYDVEIVRVILGKKHEGRKDSFEDYTRSEKRNFTYDVVAKAFIKHYVHWYV